MKRRREQSISALERAGFSHTPTYDRVVQQLRNLLICEPRWDRLTNRRFTVPPDQLRRGLTSPVFQPLEQVSHDKDGFFRTALTLPHPLNDTSTFLTKELNAATMAESVLASRPNSILRCATTTRKLFFICDGLRCCLTKRLQIIWRMDLLRFPSSSTWPQFV